MRISPGDLAGKVTDIHAHVGMSIKAYGRTEYPYGQTVEGLVYRQLANEVDFTTAFALAPALYLDISVLVMEGRAVRARAPISAVPYELENRMVFAEIYQFCPEHADRFMPFVCVDPGRDAEGQVRAILALSREYPIYGIKCSPVACQSKVTEFLASGRPLLQLAAERDLPVLLHVTTDPDEGYSSVRDSLDLAKEFPRVRFCLAHCCGFDRAYLDEAAALPNVWVDTAALTIQVQMVREGSRVMARPGDRFDCDYSDPKAAMRSLLSAYPDTIIWGSDSPWYSFISVRQQAPGVYSEFRLKATYENEKAALDALPAGARERACATNAAAFLFGR